MPPCGTAVNSKNQVFFVEFGAPKIATIDNAMHIHKIRANRYGDFCNNIGPSAKFLARAKKSLVTGVMRTRFAYVVFFA
jgi:hypothetical protein